MTFRPARILSAKTLRKKASKSWGSETFLDQPSEPKVKKRQNRRNRGKREEGQELDKNNPEKTSLKGN